MRRKPLFRAGVATWLLVSAAVGIDGGRETQAATVAVITKAGTPVLDLVSTGLFTAGQVIVLEPQGATPALLSGQGAPLYDAVLVYSNAAFDNPTSLGNALADYVDAGGGVVLAAFCMTNLSGNFRVAGRIIEEDGYSPLRPTDLSASAPGAIEWPPINPCHPVFAGIAEAPEFLSVTTFGRPELTQGGVLLARTQGGDPFVAANEAHTVLVVNAHPNANTVYNGAASRLFANALLLAANGGIEDCNLNGNPDSCDISESGSEDCQGNGIPDECEILNLQSADCNLNDVPDECEIESGTATDCNNNGRPDECETNAEYCAATCDPDCNANGVPDACEPDDPAACDCNGNGIDDALDVAETTSTDCDGNNIPDECETNGITLSNVTESSAPSLAIPDSATVRDTIAITQTGNVADLEVEVDISHTWDRDLTISLLKESTIVLLIRQRGGGGSNFAGTILDDQAAVSVSQGNAPFDGTYRPEQVLSAFEGMSATGAWTIEINDEAAPDSGTLNAWTLHLQVESAVTQDCNENGNIDACDIAAGTSSDQNGNGLPDDCESDCNFNGLPDDMDLAQGTSEDCNANLIPDECDRRTDPAADCNNNHVLDICEIDAGTGSDLDGDGMLDECARSCACGDLSGDGLIDLADFAAFIPCFEADTADLPPACPGAGFLCADLNGDMSVDLLDVATFTQLFQSTPDPTKCNW